MIDAEAYCDSSGLVQNLSGLKGRGLGRDVSPEVPATAVMDDRVKLRSRVMYSAPRPAGKSPATVKMIPDRFSS
jgi:hypothetical protein